MGDKGFFDRSRGNSRKIIIAVPSVGIKFSAHGQGPGLKCLERHPAIAKIIISDLVKIIRAAPERQGVPPIIGVAFQRQITARLERTYDIWGAADRDILEGGICKVFARPLGLFNDRSHPGNQCQLGVLF